MICLKIFSFFFICLLATCGNSALQIESTNQKQQTQEAGLTLSLERTGCWKTCPIYKLIVQLNGKVLFEGIQDTETKGKAESILNKEKMTQLVAEIEKADFFALKNSYTNVSDNCPGYGTDQPTVTLYIKTEGKEKTIIHNLGCKEIGGNWKVFPQPLYKLESKIDEIVETKYWTGEQK